MRARLNVLIILVGVGFLCAGCSANQQTVATKTMLSTQATVVAVATAADKMCAAGQLTQAQCDKIRDAYQKAGAAYDQAESLLTAAIENNTPQSWTNYEKANAALGPIYNDFLGVAQQFNLLPTETVQ